MADDEEQYYGDDDDFDWFYVEENYPLADELAETSVPDPGYPGTNAELDYSWYDFDIYEYWDDLEYGHDSYWDTAGTAVTGQKRKRVEGSVNVRKRMKLSLKEMSGDTTMFVSMADRRKLWSRRAPVKKGLKVFALLPDWEKKCTKADMKKSVKAMPTEMRQAAEAIEADTPEGARHLDADAMDEEEGDWEDEDADEQLGPEDVEAAITDMAQIANIDMNALQAVLRQKLGESGLETMDEGKFMDTMQKMLSGDTNTDDAAGDLANSLLGTVRQDDSAFEGWLSQQGVSLGDGDDGDEDAESVATAEMPESSSSSKKGKGVQTSPPDSAIEMAKGGRTAQLAMHDGSPKIAKKRSAEITEENDGSGRKRKKVTFDVPASQESEAAAATGEGEGAAMDMASSDDPLTSGPTVAPVEAASSDDPLSQPQATGKATRAKTKATRASSAPENSTTTAPKSKASRAKAGPVAEATGPAKSTRKRKAEAAAEEEPPPPAKKQTRKAVAATKDDADDGKPGYARATRSTRARSGK